MNIGGLFGMAIVSSLQNKNNNKIKENIDSSFNVLKLGMNKQKIDKLLGDGNLVKTNANGSIVRYLESDFIKEGTSHYLSGNMGLYSKSKKVYIECVFDKTNNLIEYKKNI